MNKFRYRVYYKFIGPSKEDPFATKPLSPEQVRHCLDDLCARLPSHFSVITEGSLLYVTAVTSDSEQETDAKLEKCVVSLNLATRGLSLLIDKLTEQ